MSPIFKGRYTAQLDGSFVIFIVGMRINHLWAVSKWWSAISVMLKLIKQLKINSQSGLLHTENYCYWRGFAVIQYWRSFEDLEKFSNDTNQLHTQAWEVFNRCIGDNESVGIWHETYLIDAKNYECIYRNMPKKGLALAGEHCPVSIDKNTAKQRLNKN